MRQTSRESLSRAKEETDREWVAVKIALCCRNRAAQQCVMEAGERQASRYVGVIKSPPMAMKTARSLSS